MTDKVLSKSLTRPAIRLTATNPAPGNKNTHRAKGLWKYE